MNSNDEYTARTILVALAQTRSHPHMELLGYFSASVLCPLMRVDRTRYAQIELFAS
jgi:hypothetical protein